MDTGSPYPAVEAILQNLRIGSNTIKKENKSCDTVLLFTNGKSYRLLWIYLCTVFNTKKYKKKHDDTAQMCHFWLNSLNNSPT